MTCFPLSRSLIARALYSYSPSLSVRLLCFLSKFLCERASWDNLDPARQWIWVNIVFVLTQILLVYPRGALPISIPPNFLQRWLKSLWMRRFVTIKWLSSQRRIVLTARWPKMCSIRLELNSTSWNWTREVCRLLPLKLPQLLIFLSFGPSLLPLPPSPPSPPSLPSSPVPLR